jgi:hypothetical protein
MHQHVRRGRIVHRGTIGALLILATLALAVGPAAANEGDPTTSNQTTFDPRFPTSATASITPGTGLPGTAVSVTITFWPSNACPGLSAVALRTEPGPGPNSKVVSIDFAQQQPDGSHVGIVHVPQTAVAGTVYWADGGCFTPLVVSPPQPFLVTAPEVRAQR